MDWKQKSTILKIIPNLKKPQFQFHFPEAAAVSDP